MAEEIHDAVMGEGVPPNGGAGYQLTNFSFFPDGSPYTGSTFGPILWAMQSPT
jgi:hypothetical protein